MCAICALLCARTRKCAQLTDSALCAYYFPESTGSLFCAVPVCSCGTAPFLKQTEGDSMNFIAYKLSVKSSIGVAHSFDEFISATMTDTPQKAAARYWQQTALSDESALESYKAAKKEVPLWYLGGMCEGAVKEGNITPQGLLTVDFDDLPNDEVADALKQKLSLHPSCVMAALSVGGFGVFGVFSVPTSVQTSPELIAMLWDELREFTGIKSRNLDEPHIDESCKDLARKRFESFDPCPHVNKDATEWKPLVGYANIKAACRDAFDKSAVWELASKFGGVTADDEIGAPGCAQTAFALASLAMASCAKVQGRVFTREYYPFKFQGVVFGKLGVGKSTGADKLRMVAKELNVREITPESDRRLEWDVCVSACDYVKDAGEPDGVKWTPKSWPQAVLEIIDEAGDEKSARKSRDYNAKAASIRRRLFDRLFKAASSLGTALPKDAIRTAYTNIQMTTPDQWMRASMGETGANGDARRILEFWTQSALDDDNLKTAKDIYKASMRDTDCEMATDITGALSMLNGLFQRVDNRFATDTINIDNKCSERVLDAIFDALSERWQSLDQAQLVQVAKTALCGLSTAACFARRGAYISDDDVMTAASILFAVLEVRERVKGFRELGGKTRGPEINKELLDYIGEKPRRKSSVDRLCNQNGRAYSDALRFLMASGEVIQETRRVNNKATKFVRLATDEERERADTPDFSQEQANSHKVDRGGIDLNDYGEDRQRREYADCDEETKLKRLEEYREQHNLDNPLVMHNIDNSLRSLSGKLHAAGMDDEVARQWFYDLAHGLGHTKESDKRRVWRAINK